MTLARLLTLRETAEILAISYPRAMDLARRMILPTCRLGRHYRVSAEILEEFIKSGGKALDRGWKRANSARNKEGRIG